MITNIIRKVNLKQLTEFSFRTIKMSTVYSTVFLLLATDIYITV